MSGQYDFDNNSDNLPVKSGMSTGMKILLALLVVVGLVCLTCCGVGAYFAYFVRNAVHEQPEEIRNDTAAIVEIAIPERFKPVNGMNLVLFRMVKYTTDPEGKPQVEGAGELTLFEMSAAVINEQQEQEIKQQMQKEMEKKSGENLPVEKSEDREFTIRGKKCTFQFGTFKHKDGEPWHRIQGTFPSKTGTATLVINLPDSEYDEAEIVKMIESIH